ncbi:MAG: 6-phosphogluconolactonase [Pseudomonadales bacterium]|nr:6-phosphogluconolactonase [Pseudomonadales bacterium]
MAYGRILAAAERAHASRGRFLLVLAGGHTPHDLYSMLRTTDTDWSPWHIYYGDERCLPIDDTERTSHMVAHAWLNHVLIPPEQIHTIPAELGAVTAAQTYADTLRGVDDFDLVLLGLGEDGHTASLFPDKDWGVATDAPDTLAILDAPKAPAQRVSLSARRLSRAREVIFLVEGESKRAAVKLWREYANIPACVILPPTGVDVLLPASLLD